MGYRRYKLVHRAGVFVFNTARHLIGQNDKTVDVNAGRGDDRSQDSGPPVIECHLSRKNYLTQKNSHVQELLNAVCQNLKIVHTQYFGFYFIDKSNRFVS
ncbi:hypothetical protein RF11_12560 [Thelohanellus kitauei]|uniref:FERM domain-containing protein n=1 Tax=Thelohanellus kitauei TaxID=669202 RepID=A0A0C2N1U7_THEKT|nr:hypothetical protein RF11_12560 [Thelohanellus kitauei]